MIHNVNSGETVYRQDGCTGIRLYEAEGNEYVQLSIEPEGTIPEHSLPVAVSFCVLRGAGICTVAGSEYSVTAGDMLECPPDETRGWKNDSGDLLEVLVIKRSVKSV